MRRTRTCSPLPARLAARLQYSFEHRAEGRTSSEVRPVFSREIALLEVDGTKTISAPSRSKGKPIACRRRRLKTPDLLEKFAKLNPSPSRVYYPNSYLSEAPYLPKKSELISVRQLVSATTPKEGR